MSCDCDVFRREFLNVTKDILIKGDGMPQWEVFQEFLAKYITDDRSDWICSLDICRLLMRKQTEFRLRDVPLSTVLVHVMVTLHFDPCILFNLIWRWEWDFDVITIFSSKHEHEALTVIVALQDWNLNSNLMEISLNFGLFSRLPGDSLCLMEALYEEFDFLISTTPDLPEDTDDEEHIHYDIGDKTNEALKLIKDIFFRYEDSENHKRMFLAVKASRAILYGFENNDYITAKRLIDCLRMYFTGSRDAFLSVYEVRSVLYVCLKLARKLYLFEMYCEEFHKLMPNCSAKMEPRKLTHLARCQIRENLEGSHLPLPSAVDKLVLPQILKSFLLGKIEDISQKKENVSLEKCVTLSELASLLTDQSTPKS